MGLFSSLAPLAGIGLAASGVGLPLAMGGSALFGALAGNERNRELQKRQGDSANASADAIAASWARRDGRGSVPPIQWNEESASGNLGAGALTGAMQAYGARKSNLFDGGLFGGSQAPGYELGDMGSQPGTFAKAAPGGIMGLSLGEEGVDPSKYELPTLFGKFRR